MYWVLFRYTGRFYCNRVRYNTTFIYLTFYVHTLGKNRSCWEMEWISYLNACSCQTSYRYSIYIDIVCAIPRLNHYRFGTFIWINVIHIKNHTDKTQIFLFKMLRLYWGTIYFSLFSRQTYKQGNKMVQENNMKKVLSIVKWYS